MLLVERSMEEARHGVRPRDELPHRVKPLGRQSDRLPAAVTRVALAANEAARSQARDHLSHGRSIERNTLAKRALVEARLAVQRIHRGELARLDRVRYLFIPQHGHALPAPTQRI